MSAPMEPRPVKAPGSPASPMLRQVGESYKDYAARMYGWARAAQADRDAAWAENKQLRERVAFLEYDPDFWRRNFDRVLDMLVAERERRTLGGPPPACTPGWESGPSTRPATAPEEET